MSTIRSLITGMLPIGSTTIVAVRRARARRASPSWVLQASAGLAVDAHAARAADRGAAGAADADRAVLAVLGLEDAVEHGAVPVEVDVEVLPVGAPRPTRAS